MSHLSLPKSDSIWSTTRLTRRLTANTPQLKGKIRICSQLRSNRLASSLISPRSERGFTERRNVLTTRKCNLETTMGKLNKPVREITSFLTVIWITIYLPPHNSATLNTSYLELIYRSRTCRAAMISSKRLSNYLNQLIFQSSKRNLLSTWMKTLLCARAKEPSSWSQE